MQMTLKPELCLWNSHVVGQEGHGPSFCCPSHRHTENFSYYDLVILHQLQIMIDHLNVLASII